MSSTDPAIQEDAAKTGIQMLASILTRHALIAGAGALATIGITHDQAAPIVLAVVVWVLTYLWSHVRSIKLLETLPSWAAQWFATYNRRPASTQPSIAQSDPVTSKRQVLGLYVFLMLACGTAMAVTGCNWSKLHPQTQVLNEKQSAATVIESLADQRDAGKISDDEYRQIDGLIQILRSRITDREYVANKIKGLEDQVANGATVDPATGKPLADEIGIEKANFNSAVLQYQEIVSALIKWQATVTARGTTTRPS